MRIYNSTACSARGLELLQPRRNLGDATSMHGASPRWEQAVSGGGGGCKYQPKLNQTKLNR